MSSINDWAAKAAERIHDEYEPREKYKPHDAISTRARIASIITTHAEPLITRLDAWRSWAQFVYLRGGPIALDDYSLRYKVCEQHDMLAALLRESKRPHDRGYHSESCDYPPCPRSDEDPDPKAVCNCGVDSWNARIDAVLKGVDIKP